MKKKYTQKRNYTHQYNKTIQKMYDDVTKENISKHKPNWAQISDHPYRILINGGSESGKQSHYLI